MYRTLTDIQTVSGSGSFAEDPRTRACPYTGNTNMHTDEGVQRNCSGDKWPLDVSLTPNHISPVPVKQVGDSTTLSIGSLLLF